MYVPPQVARHWLMVGGCATAGSGLAAALTIAWVRHRRPTPEQVEERRRKRLAENGRIVDGSLIDAAPEEAQPQTIIYTYRIAGVTYECAQDVSKLGSLVENLRLDYPVQVRYNRANPADSIVVAETWNGLWKTVEGSSKQLKTVRR
jgi:hypothetical protein